jgi:alcohol dehydrogenase class IV
MKKTDEFNAPGAIIVGDGAISQLTDQVLLLGGRKVMFVTDPFFISSGLIGDLTQQLEISNIETVVFSGVQPDPTVQNVESGLQILRDSGAEIIIAIGGGSPIDAAKAISIMATNEGLLSSYMGYNKVPVKGLPLIAIPTTAGTGSEATKVAVITDSERNVKMMILDRYLMPSVALIDFRLSMSMPRPLTAHVGIDTLTHGIEAYVSRKANLMTDPIALSCIGLVSRNLLTAWNEPGNELARSAMAMAACHGGLAFTNSSVCLVHGMSRPLGAIFHLAHGLSNAVLLPLITKFSIPGASEKYAVISRTMSFANSDDSDEAACLKLVERLEDLNKKLEIPFLRFCTGIDYKQFEGSLEKMANDALASGSPQNNPVVPEASEIVSLYLEAW